MTTHLIRWRETHGRERETIAERVSVRVCDGVEMVVGMCRSTENVRDVTCFECLEKAGYAGKILKTEAENLRMLAA